MERKGKGKKEKRGNKLTMRTEREREIWEGRNE